MKRPRSTISEGPAHTPGGDRHGGRVGVRTRRVGASGIVVLAGAGAVALAAGCAGTPLPRLEPVVSAGGAAPPGPGGVATGAAGALTRSAAERGRELFNGWIRPDVNCYTCHNGDGAGTWRGPNLGKRVPKLTDAEIASTIAEGPGLMPSFKGKVDGEDVRDLTAWLRARFPVAP
jgi:mono/diheme cytochrome c family protein